MKHMRLFVWILVITAVLPLTSCGIARLTGPPPLPAEMSIPHYFVRDVVQDAAVTADGNPLFTEIDAGYGFNGSNFEMSGTYVAADGAEKAGSVTVSFAVEDEQLTAEVVDHNLDVDAATLSALNENIATTLQAYVDDKFEQEILSYEDVAVDGNALIVALVHAGIDNVIPMN